jgi:hypothetical protein
LITKKAQQLYALAQAASVPRNPFDPVVHLRVVAALLPGVVVIDHRGTASRERLNLGIWHQRRSC